MTSGKRIGPSVDFFGLPRLTNTDLSPSVDGSGKAVYADPLLRRHSYPRDEMPGQRPESGVRVLVVVSVDGRIGPRNATTIALVNALGYEST